MKGVMKEEGRRAGMVVVVVVVAEEEHAPYQQIHQYPNPSHPLIHSSNPPPVLYISLKDPRTEDNNTAHSSPLNEYNNRKPKGPMGYILLLPCPHSLSALSHPSTRGCIVAPSVLPPQNDSQDLSFPQDVLLGGKITPLQRVFTGKHELLPSGNVNEESEGREGGRERKKERVRERG
ncbi:hypothetical protein E2C01_100324 [Portunus trituberculatus]|uniref:Uncharacterized protein n=1 Tax=Portunus trituberculatus TaxID=210409 RepID=A0A5B7KCS1_PORTR|nr:hypothetical protein [Portunus trituberculatus]